jgi:hypothetical protein
MLAAFGVINRTLLENLFMEGGDKGETNHLPFIVKAGLH